jgi:trimeric autotransporter adhesin
MKKLLLVLQLLLLVCGYSFSQAVGIGTTTPEVSSALDITSTNKGLLIPRMNTIGILSILAPARGLMVYDSLTNQLKVNKGTATIPDWQPVESASTNNAWTLTGNSGINSASQFIGTTDNQPLRFRTNNTPAGEIHPVTGNVFFGMRAGEANATGFANIAIGQSALRSTSKALTW